jgi:multidrug efflux pump
MVEEGDRMWQIYANDQAKTAAEYLPLIVAYRNGAAVRLPDVAEVVDSVQDLRNAGMANGKPSVLVIINRQPNANIIETVDRVQALLPSLRASVPSTIDVAVAMERTTTIRASLRDTESALAIAVEPRDPRRVPVPAQRPRDACPGRRGARSRSSARSASCTCADSR